VVRTLAIESMMQVSNLHQRPPDEYCHTHPHHTISFSIPARVAAVARRQFWWALEPCVTARGKSSLSTAFPTKGEW